MSAIVKSNEKSTIPWPPANPRRGTSFYTELAVKFVSTYPIGTRLGVE